MILNKFMIIQRIQHITRIFWKQDNLIKFKTDVDHVVTSKVLEEIYSESEDPTHNPHFLEMGMYFLIFEERRGNSDALNKKRMSCE